jgi:hypothetical protein
MDSQLRMGQYDQKTPKGNTFANPHIFQGKALLCPGPLSTITPDNLVCILSRVAEGKGPLKPQQPVPRKGDAGAKSHPVRPGEIRSCFARLFFSTSGRGFFIASPTPLSTIPNG